MGAWQEEDWDYLTYPEAKAMVESGYALAIVNQMGAAAHARRVSEERRRERYQRRAFRRLCGHE